jgi:proline iminopeptidase
MWPMYEPYESGLLDVGDGHRVFWEQSGNPDGKPVVVLHGGPGAAPWRGARRWFDPSRWRVVQLDQRMAGRSTPSASDPMLPIRANTTAHLVADLEQLRQALAIDRWAVCGASWGTTLGLAYAQRHVGRVTEMLLVSIALTRRRDVHWLYHDAGRFFPEERQRFAAGGGNADDLVAAYHHLLHEHPDRAVRERAAADWCAWEDAVVSLEEGWKPNPAFADPGFRMAFARLVTHFFHHAAWLAEDELVTGAARLASIPGVLVHGRFDISGPLEGAWQLNQAWPGSVLHAVPTGHVGGAAMLAPILATTDAWAR